MNLRDSIMQVVFGCGLLAAGLGLRRDSRKASRNFVTIGLGLLFVGAIGVAFNVYMGHEANP
jgi:hypothetical protein